MTPPGDERDGSQVAMLGRGGRMAWDARFVTKVIDLNGLPFELTLDPALEFELDDRLTWWYWTVSMRVKEADAGGLPTARERIALDALQRRIVTDLRAAAPVFVIGATIHQRNYELMLYAADEVTAVVGGTIAEMKGAYAEEEGRLQGYRGKVDPELQVLRTYARA